MFFRKTGLFVFIWAFVGNVKFGFSVGGVGGFWRRKWL